MKEALLREQSFDLCLVSKTNNPFVNQRGTRCQNSERESNITSLFLAQMQPKWDEKITAYAERKEKVKKEAVFVRIFFIFYM